MFYKNIMGLDVYGKVTSKLKTEGDEEIRGVHINLKKKLVWLSRYIFEILKELPWIIRYTNGFMDNTWCF